jgi:hypothetical protein
MKKHIYIYPKASATKMTALCKDDKRCSYHFGGDWDLLMSLGTNIDLCCPVPLPINAIILIHACKVNRTIMMRLGNRNTVLEVIGVNLVVPAGVHRKLIGSPNAVSVRVGRK